MRRRPARGARARANCHRKVTYTSWDQAEAEGLRIWVTTNAPTRKANPATPYQCIACGAYHLANYVPPLPRRREILARVPLRDVLMS